MDITIQPCLDLEVNNLINQKNLTLNTLDCANKNILKATGFLHLLLGVVLIGILVLLVGKDCSICFIKTLLYF